MSFGYDQQDMTQHKHSFKIEPFQFEKIPLSTKFKGKYVGFRPAKEFWIVVCELEGFSKISEDGNVQVGRVDFIICSKTEKTLSEILSLKQVHKNKILMLTFKGLSKNGHPIFFHKFI